MIATELIQQWKESLESFKIELDNLDKACLAFDEDGEVVVRNEHGTEFPVSELSENEIKIFSYWIIKNNE
jgi:hypothetical protein